MLHVYVLVCTVLEDKLHWKHFIRVCEKEGISNRELCHRQLLK